MGFKRKEKYDPKFFELNGKKRVALKQEILERNKRKKMKSQQIHEIHTNNAQQFVELALKETVYDVSLKTYLDSIESNMSNVKYSPLKEYDYHMVVLISSYNRFEKVSRMVDQFLNQKSRYKIKIILLNDGSTDVNYNVFKKYGTIDYHENVKNNGRNFYWYTVTQLWGYSKKYKSDTILMIDDDFILSENFVNCLLETYYKLKNHNNNIVCIAPHLHSTSLYSPYQAWWYNTYSIDGIGIFDRNFIAEFNYELKPVTDQELNSATHAHGWSQIHTKILQDNKIAYKTKSSIAKHDGMVSMLGKDNVKKAVAHTQKLIEKDIRISDLIYFENMNKTEKFILNYFEAFRKVFPNLLEEDFRKYYEESKYGGYPEEPGGSIWESEGKSIYVLIRLLKPKNIIEIGNFLGRSSNHILQAVEANGFGNVTLLDIAERLEYDKLHNRNFTRVLNDSLKFLQTEELDYDLIIQDGCHEYDHVNKELDLITSRAKNGFIIWAHDWFTVRPPQCEVQRAWQHHVDKFTVYSPMIDPVSNCGFVLAEFKK